MALSGNLAWFPTTKNQRGPSMLLVMSDRRNSAVKRIAINFIFSSR